MLVEQKPKILYIITKSNFGGAQKYVFDLATDPVILSDFDVSAALGGAGELIDRLEEKKIKVLKLKELQNTLSPVKTFKIVREMVKLIKIEKPDLVHINSSLAGVAGGVACKLTNTKSVFTAHGWPFNENRSLFQRTIFKMLMILTVILTNKTITVSKSLINQLSYLKYFLNHKFVTIYHGLRDISFVGEEETVAKFNIDKNKFNIVSIGELHPSKGHDLAIEALNGLSEDINFHYHIIGEGNFRPELENKISFSNLENKVTLHGSIKDAAKYLEHFDLFVLPSRTEALGYVLLEAYAAGLPIVASDVGGVREVIETAGEGELINGKIDDIKEAIEKSSKIKIIRSRKIVWHYQDMIKNTIEIYNQILKIHDK